MKLLVLVATLSMTYAYTISSFPCALYKGDGCCYNGLIYDRGDTWPSELYCLQVFCYGKNHTIVNGCPFVSKGCSSGYKDGLTYPDCCPTDECAVVYLH